MSGAVFRGLEPVKAARQDGDEGNPYEGDQACVRSFEERVQSAVAAEPGKRPLDDPSKAGRNEGAFCATGLGFDGNTQVKASSLQYVASIRQVTKRFAAKSTRRYRFETWKDTRCVMSIGRRYDNGYRKPMLIDDDIHLNTFDFLATIDPSLSTPRRGAAGPTVHNDHRRLRMIAARRPPAAEQIDQELRPPLRPPAQALPPRKAGIHGFERHT